MDPVEGRRAPVDDITILHVDDNAELCRLTSEILARETDGIETITEGTVSDGLARLDDTEGIDCVVSDYELPDRTGIEFLEAVRREHADLPFILFTGKGSEAVASEAIAAGATDYLRKQVGTQQYDLLANRVRNAVAQYRSERERRRNERRFKAVFEDPEMHVGLLDPDGTVLDINHTAMEYIDADLDEVTGELFWETPWWGKGDEVGDEVREWTERAAAGEYVDFEADLTRPDGQQYTLEGFFRPVTDDDGEVVSIIVSDRNVSERREYERQLVESERRYRTLAESFPNGVVTLYDEDLHYTLAAGRAFEKLPVSPEDLEDRTPGEAWGEDVGDDLEPALRAALDGEEQSIELSYVGREWLVHAVPITDERGDVFAGMSMAHTSPSKKNASRNSRRRSQSSKSPTTGSNRSPACSPTNSATPSPSARSTASNCPRSRSPRRSSTSPRRSTESRR